jgi:hypothetical protein
MVKVNKKRGREAHHQKTLERGWALVALMADEMIDQPPRISYLFNEKYVYIDHGIVDSATGQSKTYLNWRF